MILLFSPCCYWSRRNGDKFYNHFFGLELLYHIDSINSNPAPACSRARQGWVSVFSELTCIFSHPLPREIKKFAISLGQHFLPPLYGQSCPSAFSAPRSVFRKHISCSSLDCARSIVHSVPRSEFLFILRHQEIYFIYKFDWLYMIFFNLPCLLCFIQVMDLFTAAPSVVFSEVDNKFSNR